MQINKPSTAINTILLCLVCVMMGYILTRAVMLDMTHDEAYSFYNVKHFWWVEALCTGNTHWFNFLAIKTALLLGFEKAAQLRWFSLVSAGISLTVVFYWIRSLNRLPIKIMAFCVAFLNPFVIDYLSLARGYSAALMFEVLSIACYCMAMSKNQRNLGTLALFFAGMSAIANFNFFYFFVAFAFIHAWSYYKRQGFAFLKQRLFYVEFLFSVGIGALVIKALRFIETCSNDIGAYGGDELVDSVFSSFIRTLLYGNFKLSATGVQIAAYVLCFGLCSLCIYGIATFKKHRNTWYRLSSVLFLLMLGLTVFNRWCLGVLYPIDRTILMFYPLMALVVSGFFKTLVLRAHAAVISVYGISIFYTLNFYSSVNLNHTFDYYRQADTQKAFTCLENLRAKHVGMHSELFGVYRNYYQLTDHNRFDFTAEPINVYFPKGMDSTKVKLREFDYVLLCPPYDVSFYKNNKVKLRTVNYFVNTGTVVLKVE